MITLQRPGALTALPPLSLYVHLPWCLKKCPYCDFNSHEAPPKTPGASRLGAEKEAAYLDALRADLEAALPQIWGRRVHTIFIGGGTPSLFSPEAIDRLLADIRARLPLEPGCEVTLEANPGTFERDRFKAFRDAGVTRLSIGVQSFDDTKLKALGRVHDRAQALAAVEEAQRCFDTFNLDLMYARPGHHCEHNLNYWQFGDYLGIGAGAHSKISFPERIVRQVRWREPGTYMDKAVQGQPNSNENEDGLSARPFEFMMNALRLKDGFELQRFAERTGLTLASIQKPLAEAEAKGLLQRDLARAWPTDKGFDFLSDLQALFLNE